MKPNSLALKLALQALANSAVFSHMRKVAYTPPILNRSKSAAEVLLNQFKAQEKRARKNAKRAALLNKGV